MPLASYPFLSVFWTMCIFFLFVIWIMILFRVFGDIFRRHDVGGGNENALGDSGAITQAEFDAIKPKALAEHPEFRQLSGDPRRNAGL